VSTRAGVKFTGSDALWEVSGLEDGITNLSEEWMKKWIIEESYPIFT
jgi:hypothetical protein